MTQPIAFYTPDANVQGFIDLPEFPFALESRWITRFDAARYARVAYEAGKTSFQLLVNQLAVAQCQ